MLKDEQSTTNDVDNATHGVSVFHKSQADAVVNGTTSTLEEKKDAQNDKNQSKFNYQPASTHPIEKQHLQSLSGKGICPSSIDPRASKVSTFFSIPDTSTPAPPCFLSKHQFQQLRQYLSSFTDASKACTSLHLLSTFIMKTHTTQYIITKKQLHTLIPHLSYLHPQSLKQAGLQSYHESKDLFLVDLDRLLNNVALTSAFVFSFSSTVPRRSSLHRPSIAEPPSLSTEQRDFFTHYYRILTSRLHTMEDTPVHDMRTGSTPVPAAMPGWTYDDVLELLKLGERHCRLDLPANVLSEVARSFYDQLDLTRQGVVQVHDFVHAAVTWLDPCLFGLWCHPKGCHENPDIKLPRFKPTHLATTPSPSSTSSTSSGLPSTTNTKHPTTRLVSVNYFAARKNTLPPRCGVKSTPLPVPLTSSSHKNTGWCQSPVSDPCGTSTATPGTLAHGPVPYTRALNEGQMAETPNTVCVVSSASASSLCTDASSGDETNKTVGKKDSFFASPPPSSTPSHSSLAPEHQQEPPHEKPHAKSHRHPPMHLGACAHPELVKRWWSMKGTTWVSLGLLFLCCTVFFSLVFIHYCTKEVMLRYFGYALAFAKGGAMLIHLTLVFLLLSMCRLVLTQVHYVCPWLPIHKACLWHRYAGTLLVLASIVHTLAHVLVTLPVVARHPALQRVVLHHPSPPAAPLPATAYWFLAATPSWTGWALLAVLVLIAGTSFPRRVRRRHYEVFYYTHFLFLVFLGLLCVHGTGQWLSPPSSWKYLLFPTLVYVAERTVRAFRTYTSPASLVCLKHDGDTLLLKLVAPPSFNSYQPGQYMYLNAPWISKWQWHPFSVTSDPASPYLTFLVRCKGSWTRQLASGVMATTAATAGASGRRGEGDGAARPWAVPAALAMAVPPTVYVDGVFGGYPHLHRYTDLVFLASGIGCTPFLSMAQRLDPTSTTTVEFIWITRKWTDIEWLFQSLPRLHPCFRLHVYVTSACACEPTAALFWQAWQAYQAHRPWPQPHVHVYWGRPRLPAVLEAVGKQHGGNTAATIGLFFCGGKPLGKELARLVYAWNMDARHSVAFDFYKESF